MIVKKAELETVAVKKSQYPEDNVPEVAFAGRSNVGKSSLLNLLTNRKSLARVSGSPGKTRTINFYRINDAFRIVDLPGYGYAKVSKSMTENWGDMMEEYFQNRQGLKKVIQLVDIRHEPSREDIFMHDVLLQQGLSVQLIANKIDKVSKNQRFKSLAVIAKTMTVPADQIIPFSAVTGEGKEKLQQIIEDYLLEKENISL